MKKMLPALAVALVLSFIAWGNPIKTWIPGDIITAADLNSALGHIHTTMVGGHGARLVNADVASNAAISLSKISGGLAQTSHAWGRFDCATSCSTAVTSGFAGVPSGNPLTGTTVSFTSACTGSGTVLVSADRASSVCYPTSISTTSITFACTAQPAGVNVAVFCL